MVPTTSNSSTLPGSVYVPEDYALRQQYLCGNPLRINPAEPHAKRYATYDFSSERKVGEQDGGPQTVEDLITRGYLSVLDSNPETAILEDRRQTAWLGLDDAITQIKQRHEIYLINVYEIEIAKCDAVNELFECEKEQGAPANERQRKTLAGRLQELYADQRKERLTLWKDVSGLRSMLPESAQQYLAAHRRSSILGDGDETR